MRLALIQDNHRAWSERNFPDRNPDFALLGVIEETGELSEAIELHPDTKAPSAMVIEMMVFLGRLAHIHLKQAQGIRKGSSSEARRTETVDQLARLLREYCDFTAIDADDKVSAPPFQESEDEARDAVGDITIYLMDLCTRRGWNYEKIVEATAATVLARDWVKDPLKGLAS